jgi:hypothetical protein
VCVCNPKCFFNVACDIAIFLSLCTRETGINISAARFSSDSFGAGGTPGVVLARAQQEFIYSHFTVMQPKQAEFLKILREHKSRAAHERLASSQSRLNEETCCVIIIIIQIDETLLLLLTPLRCGDAPVFFLPKHSAHQVMQVLQLNDEVFISFCAPCSRAHRERDKS